MFLYILKGMVKCDFWELESTQKLLWFKFEKCLNTEKLLPCYFYHGWSIDPNSNIWTTREAILGRPAKHSAYAGWLSRCPHVSVRRGGTKRYGAMWDVRSGSNLTAGSHRRRWATPARQKPSAASGGCWGLTGVLPRVGEAGERRSRQRRTQGWSR